MQRQMNKTIYILISLLCFTATSCVEFNFSDLFGNSSENVDDSSNNNSDNSNDAGGDSDYDTTNYSIVTIEYDYYNGSAFCYKDFELDFDGNKYTSIGKYKVPEGSIVKMSWYWAIEYIDGPGTWSKASYEVSALGNMHIRIERNKAFVTYDE